MDDDGSMWHTIHGISLRWDVYTEEKPKPTIISGRSSLHVIVLFQSRFHARSQSRLTKTFNILTIWERASGQFPFSGEALKWFRKKNVETFEDSTAVLNICRWRRLEPGVAPTRGVERNFEMDLIEIKMRQNRSKQLSDSVMLNGGSNMALAPRFSRYRSPPEMWPIYAACATISMLPTWTKLKPSINHIYIHNTEYLKHVLYNRLYNV